MNPYTDGLFEVNGRMGLFTYETASYSGINCVRYTRQQFELILDLPFRFAYGSAIMANISTGVSMLLLVMLNCWAVPKTIVNRIGLLSMLGCLFMAATFFSSKSYLTDYPYNASLSRDAALAIVSCVLSFITSVLICSARAAKSYLQDEVTDAALESGGIADETGAKTATNSDASQTSDVKEEST